MTGTSEEDRTRMSLPPHVFDPSGGNFDPDNTIDESPDDDVPDDYADELLAEGTLYCGVEEIAREFNNTSQEEPEE